jgi:hypothetical protein
VPPPGRPRPPAPTSVTAAFRDGAAAGRAGIDRVVPDALDAEARDDWLIGYDFAVAAVQTDW